LVLDQLPNRNQLIWTDRSGDQLGSLDDLANVAMVNLAPDGQHFIVPRLDLQTGNNDLWLSDVRGKKRHTLYL
jgi:hypothetical protein